MDTNGWMDKVQKCLNEIPDLRNEKQLIGSPKVKAWKTEVEQLLKLGGKNTAKLLQNFQAMRFGASAMGSENLSNTSVRFQAYQAELDTAEKLLKNAIQTIQIFGISEEAKLPDWFKQEAKTTGTIRIGTREVDIKTITLYEFLHSLALMAESDKSLDDSLKQEIIKPIESMKKHSLLQPFLNQSLDKLFSKM